MVNSASQALSEFKSQRMGGLLAGTSSTVNAPSMVGTSLMDSASDRMARSAPKRSTTAFMDGIRKSGQNLHSTALAGLQAKQSQITGVAGGTGARGPARGGVQYQLPSGGGNTGSKGGPRGAHGLAVPAANAFGQLSGAYAKKFGSQLSVTSGGRTYDDQVKAWNRYQAGGPKAAKPGTSLHESGIAIDLGGPIQSTGTAQHAWLRQNAAQFKWYWVGQRYGEPWHWEYHPEWK